MGLLYFWLYFCYLPGLIPPGLLCNDRNMIEASKEKNPFTVCTSNLVGTYMV